MKLQLKKGSTSVRVMVFIADSSSTTGAGKTGLAFNSSGLKWYYWRGDTGNNPGVSVTPATATLGTFTSGGFKEIDATNLPGLYEIGIPDAAIASGSLSVAMMLHGVSGMAPLPLEIQLVAYDPENATTLGLTNLDAAMSSRLASASITLSGGAVTVGTNNDKAGYALSSGGIAAIWDSLTSGMVNAGSIGKRIVDYLTGDIFARIGSNGAGLTAIGPVTLATSQPNYAPAKAGDAMTLTSGERTAIATAVETACINEADGNALLEAMTDAIAAANPDLSALSANLIAAAVRTNLAAELGRIDVAVSTLATASSLTTVGTNVSSALSSINTLKGDWDNGGRLDLLLDQTLADTNELQTDWATGGTLKTELDTIAGNAGSAASVISDVNDVVGEIAVIANKIDTMLAVDGSNWKLTTGSLQEAPSGGGTPPTAAEIAEEIFSTANGINTGESFRQWARRVRAVLYGKTSGMRTGTEVFKAADGTTTLVSVSVDRKGNRSGVTLT